MDVTTVDTRGHLPIGGIDQWVTVRGRHSDNPLLIVVHGGPGMAETPWYRSFNADLEAAFTVVYWDQRGAGRSYASSRTAVMNIERFVADLDELIDIVCARLRKRQVVLMCHSWGTIVGTIYASRQPAKVAAYVGIGQISNMAQSELESYEFALAQAQRRGHRRAQRDLRAMGRPPLSPPALERQRRWLTTFGGAFGVNMTMTKLIWRALTAPGSTPLDLVRLVRGLRFSLNALWEQMQGVRLDRDYVRFEVPVFFLLGRLDKQVVATLSADYFEHLGAPHKELVWFEESGHLPPFEEPAKFNATMIERVRPFAG